MGSVGIFSLSDQDSPHIEVALPDGTTKQLDLWEFYDFGLKNDRTDDFAFKLIDWLAEKLGVRLNSHHATKLYEFAIDTAISVSNAERKVDEEKKAQSSTAS